MELRSRRLSHIPHVAFIMESVHACLHRERPESAALSMPSGKLAFIFDFRVFKFGTFRLLQT